MDPTLVGIFAFMAIGLIVIAIGMVLRDLRQRAPAAASESPTPLRLSRLPLARDEQLAEAPIARFDKWFDLLITESGLPWTPLTAVLVLVFCGTVLGGGLFAVTDQPFPATIGMFVGMAGAMGFILYKRYARINLLQDQLPPALEMLSRAVHAGESLDQAVSLVGDKSPEPLAIEFRRAANQLQMGLSLAAVMRSLVHRVRMLDVKIFTTTLAVHRQTGGSLAITLERLAAVIRDRLNYRRQLRATTGAGRLSAIMIGAAGPLLFVYMFVVQREYIQGMLDSSIGQMMLAVAIMLEVIGLIWVARVLRPSW